MESGPVLRCTACGFMLASAGAPAGPDAVRNIRRLSGVSPRGDGTVPVADRPLFPPRRTLLLSWIQYPQLALADGHRAGGVQARHQPAERPDEASEEQEAHEKDESGGGHMSELTLIKSSRLPGESPLEPVDVDQRPVHHLLSCT